MLPLPLYDEPLSLSICSHYRYGMNIIEKIKSLQHDWKWQTEKNLNIFFYNVHYGSIMRADDQALYTITY